MTSRRKIFLHIFVFLLFVCDVIDLVWCRGGGRGGGGGFGARSFKAFFSPSKTSSKSSKGDTVRGGGHYVYKSTGPSLQFVFLMVVISIFGLAAMALITKFLIYYCCCPDNEFDDIEIQSKAKKKPKDHVFESNKVPPTLSHKTEERRTARRKRTVHELDSINRRIVQSQKTSERSKKRRLKAHENERRKTPTAPGFETLERHSLLKPCENPDTAHHYVVPTAPHRDTLDSNSSAESSNDDLWCELEHDGHDPRHERVHSRRTRRYSESYTQQGRAHDVRFQELPLGAATLQRQYSAPLPFSAAELGFTERTFLEGPPTYEESIGQSQQSLPPPY